MTVRMIVAYNGQEIIGKDNKIPWFYKSDLQFFKKMTTGGVVIMGRKTWESLPPKMRPLPERVNIVVTSGNGLVGAECTVHSVSEGVRFARSYYPSKDIWLIGGRGVYSEGLSLADETLVSLVPDVVEVSDSVVYWPGFGASWKSSEPKDHPMDPSLKLVEWRRA